jgi:hypothetical protein
MTKPTLDFRNTANSPKNHPTLQKASLPWCSQRSGLIDMPLSSRTEELHTWLDVSGDAAERNIPVAQDTFLVAIGGLSRPSLRQLRFTLSHTIRPSSLPFSDYPKTSVCNCSRNVGIITNQHSVIFQKLNAIVIHVYKCLTLFLNLLKTKRILLYIRNQSVPRCKHFPPRL